MHAMRPTLAAAVQRSSTSGSFGAAGSDPSVGKVYSNAPHQSAMSAHASISYAPSPQRGPAPGAPPAGYGPSPGQVPSTQGPPQGLPPQATPPGALPSAGSMLVTPGLAGDDQSREVQRLRRDLKKSEEKSNFFRNQVIALQQQVSSMTTPVMGAHEASAMPEEIVKLRQELHEERSRCQASQQKLQDQAAELEAARATITRLEQQLTDARFEAAPRQASVTTPALATGGNWSSVVTQPVGSPFASAATVPVSSPVPGSPVRGTRLQEAYASTPGPSPLSSQIGGRGDPLDPVESPGGPKRALIIGCDYPGKPGVLRAGVADGLQWARFFMKRCGLLESDIRFLSDDPSQYQQKARPESAVATKDNVLRALQWLVARSTPGDQLFFVFCGHGAQIQVEDRSGQRLCECAVCPTDVTDGGDYPRVVRDTDIHHALLAVPGGVQVAVVNDSCHGGSPLDRSGRDHLTTYVSRGRVDYEKLKGHPVLPRFFELANWKVQPGTPTQNSQQLLRCQAVHWRACANEQFCVELPIDERPRGVFTYIFISSLLKAGVQASSGMLLNEARELTAQLKGRWRLMQDVQITYSRSTSEQQPFLRL